MTSEEQKRKWKKYNDKRKEYRKNWRQKNKQLRGSYKSEYWDKRWKKGPFVRLSYSLNYYSNKKLGLILPTDLYRIAKKQKLRCALTGEKLTNENISVDHIIPRSRGGTNVPDNLRLVILNANIARQALSDSDFLELCRKVVAWADASSVR